MTEPNHNTANETVFTLRRFVEAGAARLRLEVVAGGSSLDHIVEEPVMYRPGLALTGFFDVFAWRRIQVIGLAESCYLNSLAAEERLARFRALFEHKAYCVVFVKDLAIPEGLKELAEEFSVAVLRSGLETREFFQFGSFLLGQLRAPTTKIYGTMVEVAGLGVMLEGSPGLGKSETALGLIKHGNALIADDLTCLRKDVSSNRIYATASPATRNYMEIRGIGIIHVPSIFGVTAVLSEKPLDLVITFRRMSEVDGELDRVGDERNTREILGVKVPQIMIPVSAGRDLVNLVETAAHQFKLRLAGHDVIGELDRHLKERASVQEGEMNG